MATLLEHVFGLARLLSTPLAVALLGFTVVGIALLGYLSLFIVAPLPREPLDSEKGFRTIDHDGGTTRPKSLPCWHNIYDRQRQSAQKNGSTPGSNADIEQAELFMSLVVPAYNEEQRLRIMLAEAVDYLQQEYGDAAPTPLSNGVLKRQRNEKKLNSTIHEPKGWEILIISDGSTDKTTETALDFARELGGKPSTAIRVISLQENRGKGGAVTHGMRHVRGKYAIFADADRASKFDDLGKLLQASKEIEDVHGRVVAVGSRAYLVGSEAVARRSFLRNLLMHSFHFLIRFLTPPATASIRDTQCGFKLFSRASLPHIIPNMHSEGWIFDVEMLMLAEAAGIPVVEVPIGWKEVKGSKLNVVWDSLGMAWGLAVLRAAWGLGVYRRK